MTFGIGASVGEEWLFKPQTGATSHVQQSSEPVRQETCFARVNSCVLELSWSELEQFKEIMLMSTQKKDISLLESMLKRNATLKKGF